jgi:hypothetical protein
MGFGELHDDDSAESFRVCGAIASDGDSVCFGVVAWLAVEKPAIVES